MNNNYTLTNIKVYTIILVIIGHVLAIYTPNSIFPHLGTRITSIMHDIIYSFHMPLFISVSGAVYAICRKRGKYSTWDELLKAKWRRVLLPYFSFGLIILFPVLIALDKMQVNVENITSIIYGDGNIKHLWYLYVLFEMFIITRTIEKILNSWIVFSVIVCTTIIAYNIALPSIFQINMLLKYYIYFILGYYVGNETIKINLQLYQGFILLVIGLLGNYYMYQLPPIPYSIVNIITSLSLSILAFTICQKYNLLQNTKFYEYLKKVGMGIYLFHVVIIYILFRYNLFGQLGIYIQATLVTLISFFISIIITRLIRSIKLGFLIGE